MIIAVDFDGTCVTHEYPIVGKDIGAVPVLNKLIAAGHQLILFTMRSNSEKNQGLADAVKWFEDNNIPLYGINTNPTQKNWTKSPKAYAQLYIDDAGINCPLLVDDTLSDRPFVNWVEVEKILQNTGIL